MVNVHAHFPFNLQDRPDSSCPSSRNVSGGTLPSSRAPSPSPPRPLQKSPSTTSFPPDADDAPHHLPLAANPSAPILNVRLVKSARTTQSTRGRSQRSGDPNGRAPALDSDPAHDPDAPPPLEVPHVSPPLHHLLVTVTNTCFHPSFLSAQKRHHIPRTLIYMTQALWHVHGATDHIFHCLCYAHFRSSYILPSIAQPLIFSNLVISTRPCFHNFIISPCRISLRSFLPDMLSSTPVPTTYPIIGCHPCAHASIPKRYPSYQLRGNFLSQFQTVACTPQP